MKAITVIPGQKQSTHFVPDAPDPQPAPGEALVRVLRVGLCGTDAEISEGLYGEAPGGSNYLILGHENFGVVESVSGEIKGIQPGDHVVASVRRPCTVCFNCLHGRADLCSSGQYTERGIKGRHGYMAERYCESGEFLFKIDRAIREIGVLLEPMTIVEKGVAEALEMQKRLPSKPKTALVLGAGPVGLLGAAALRVRDLDTMVVSRESDSDERAQIAKALGCNYHSVENTPLDQLSKQIPAPDIILECTGSTTAGFAAMQMLAADGILCLLSVTGGDKTELVHAAEINRELVLRNNVVFGSVNASPTHYRLAIRALKSAEKKWPGTLARLLTTRLPWTDFAKWFNREVQGIKSTLEISS
ncbi:MAG TPA: glucose 1-dehydrogenase [Candidatus Dormibacteraeota bacterium]|nr:glucose 1-dehydrogenase [Candidatus Dormibacteraeota bacterium]